MSITAITATTADHSLASRVAPRYRLLSAGLVYGVVASIATSLVVVAARAADVQVAIDGERVPLYAFAQLTMVGALLGVLIAKVLSRRADRPRTTFVRTTVALTALSIIPDLLVSASTGSRIVLAATHVLAAAIIIPALAARLHD